MGISALRICPMPPALFAGNVTNQAMSASTTKTGVVFTARETVTIDRLGFTFASKTGTAPNYKISLQSVDASGLPSGTILGATANGFATFDPNAFASASVPVLNLGEGVDLSAGEKYAQVVEYSSGTVNASNMMTVSYQTNVIVSAHDIAFGYPLTSTGTWTKSSGGVPLHLYANSSDAFGVPIAAARSVQAFTNTTEMGFAFSIPAPFSGSGTYRLRGFDFLGNSAAGDTWTITLYEGGGASDTTSLDTATVDTDCFVSPTSAARRQVFFPDTPPALQFGSTYRIGILNSDGTSHFMGMVPITTASDVAAFRIGTTFYRSNRSGGNWTDTTSQVPMVFQFFLEDITISGAPVRHPGMIGGLAA